MQQKVVVGDTSNSSDYTTITAAATSFATSASGATTRDTYFCGVDTVIILAIGVCVFYFNLTNKLISKYVQNTPDKSTCQRGKITETR